jgi:hypothetical protein
MMTLVKLSTIAAQWDVSVHTVRRFAKRHDIPLYHLGPRCVRVDAEDFKRWACAGKETSGEFRSRSKDGALAQRLGPAKKRKGSPPKSAEIVPFPDRDSRQSAA